MKKLIYNTFRGAYGIDDSLQTMTVGELITILEEYDEDTPFYLSFDNGYTYGGITQDRFENDEENEEDDQ